MPVRVQSLRSSTKNTRPAAGSREPGEIFSNFPDKQIGVIDASKNPLDLVAVRFFSATTNYAAGDFVHNAGHVYRANKSIVAGAFNPTDWDTAPTSGEFEPPIPAGTTADYWRGDKSWQTLNKSAVGLGAVDNTSDANKPVSTAQQTALNLKANLASPTFTGDPRAPTPAYPDNDTSIATTAFVATNFATLISPVFGGDPQAPTPATSDNDTSIATTAYVKANMAGFAPLASPVFTGDPKAPTPGPGDNDTSIATTAYVTAAVATGVGTVNPFPEAPNDGLTYGRKNLAWSTIVGGAVVSDGAPVGPLQNGQLWFRSNTGDTFIYVDDGNSQQWVQQNVVPPITIPSNYITATAQARNRIVNGAMQISQENAKGVAYGGADTYEADQWQTSWTSGGTPNHGCFQDTTSADVDWYNRLNSTVADTSIAAADFFRTRQIIEGIRIADFKWGTANAKQAVLRFKARSSILGTFGVSVGTFSAGVSFAKNCTFTQINTWQDFTIVIPGPTTGTWPINTAGAVIVAFAPMAGSNFIAASDGVWSSGLFLAAPGVSNWLSVAGQTFDYANVGLYLDPNNTGTPPPWQMPDEADELAACQRYWQVMRRLVISGYNAAGQSIFQTFATPVVMRIDPAISGFNTTFSNTNTGSFANNGTKASVVSTTVALVAAGAGYVLHDLSLNARM